MTENAAYVSPNFSPILLLSDGALNVEASGARGPKRATVAAGRLAGCLASLEHNRCLGVAQPGALPVSAAA